MMEVAVRPAQPGESDAVVALLDPAMLAFDREAVPGRIRRDAVFVATVDGAIRAGALLAGGHVEAIAVAPSQRGKGMGRAMIDAIYRRNDRVTATCRPEVASFYVALDFSLYELPDGRLFCHRSS